MGKYYSRIGGNLYIYVTRGDSLIDLKYFPNELNLFTAESAWRIKDKMAIVNDADEANVDKAEIILSLSCYCRRSPRWPCPLRRLRSLLRWRSSYLRRGRRSCQERIKSWRLPLKG
ncbi:hypothetical protein GH157_01980 [archaeon]|nr:hypothetical protein [archaeon]